jgi:chemotaxis protein MotA
VKRRTRLIFDRASLVGAPLAVLVLLGAHVLDGGRVRTLLQPTAAVVVFGGTIAAMLLSFPYETLRRAMRATSAVFASKAQPPKALVAKFTDYAIRVRRRNVLALESEISSTDDRFLSRALTMVVDGMPAAEVRETLELDSRAREDADEESAHVLETAAGYTPTLGILGAVLGLIHVMENLSAPATLGQGIAVAFVATVYGVGTANLVLLPLATKLRQRARTAALTRDLIIEGIGALQRSLAPKLMEQHLSGLVVHADDDKRKRVA